MSFAGSIWVDGRPATGQVVASINGERCGASQTATHQPPFSFFVISIVSDAVQPGCGVPGAPITLAINGRRLADALVWQPGLQHTRTLYLGEPFGEYYGKVQVSSVGSAPQRVVPFVNGTLCGEQLQGGFLFEPGIWDYQVVVDSAAHTAGCGEPGAVVTLRLQFSGSPDIDLGSVTWQPGPAVMLSTFDLSNRAVTATATTATTPIQ
jgi:hypothetical protein